MLAVHRVGFGISLVAHISWVDGACIEYMDPDLRAVKSSRYLLYQDGVKLHLAACITHAVHLSDTSTHRL